MDKILGGLVLVNNVDIWDSYGVFLTEKKKGGKDNLKEILRASKVKPHVGVNIREENGRKYSSSLTVVNDERDITLHFALFAETKDEWWQKYRDFIGFIKQGEKGWLNVNRQAVSRLNSRTPILPYNDNKMPFEYASNSI